MFLKHVIIVAIILCILGFIYADRLLYYQGEYMEKQQYYLSAYEAYAKIPQYYPQSPLARKAKEKMDKLRDTSYDVKKKLSSTETVLKKEQKKREATESFR